MITYKLPLRGSGMFSNVNEVVQQLYLADRGGYRFMIRWNGSPYRDADKPGNPWGYYFEQPFAVDGLSASDLPVLPHGPKVRQTRANIITPRGTDGRAAPLLLPKDRFVPAAVIDRHLKLDSQVLARVEEFVSESMTGTVVGLHLRGPGRNKHGGTGALRRRYETKQGVPFDQYFKYVDAALERAPDARVFACSDSEFVIAEVTARYGDRLFTYPASRSWDGEMHAANRSDDEPEPYWRYRLGEDVVVEAHALARCDFFVHGCSNVANFVLCKNPALESSYVYEDEGDAGLQNS